MFKMKSKFLFFSLVILFSTNSFAQLSGKAKSNFIDAYIQSCYNSQRSASVNKPIDDKTIYQYCKCSANYISDLMNNDLLKSIERGEQKMNPNIIQLAASYCTNNYSKY